MANSSLQQGFEAQVYLEVKGGHKFGTFLVANSILQQSFEAQVYLEYLSLEPKCARWDLGHNGKEATSKLHDHGRVSNRQFCTADFAFLSLARVSKVHSLMPLGENRPALPPTISWDDPFSKLNLGYNGRSILVSIKPRITARWHLHITKAKIGMVTFKMRKILVKMKSVASL